MTDDESQGRVRALVVPADGPGELRSVEGELTALQGIVGGWLEGVGPAGDAFTTDGVPASEIGWHAYCDEEGKLKSLKGNRVATMIAWSLGWPTSDILCGPVVFLGNGDDGEEADVPDAVVQHWHELKDEV